MWQQAEPMRREVQAAVEARMAAWRAGGALIESRLEMLPRIVH